MSGDRVGVVSGSELAAEVEAAGGTPVVGSVDDPGDVRFVVAGESALVDFARAGVDVPVLPVGAGPGVRSVPRADAEAAIERVLESGARAERHPILSVSSGTGGARALFDVALMAAEPARISEFSVRYGDERVARFRADGVVASTPAGSPEYNHAAGGPVLAPDVDALSVVPVAPFATDADRWVLPAGEVTLSVERDETPVELLADGRTVRSVAPGEPVSLAHAGDLRGYVVPESREFF